MTHINERTVISAHGGVEIGSRVLVAAGCIITTMTHAVEPAERSTILYRPVRILDGAWLGAGAIVLPGVTIGEDAVVGAGAVVTRDVERGAVVVGSPARQVAQ